MSWLELVEAGFQLLSDLNLWLVVLAVAVVGVAILLFRRAREATEGAAAYDHWLELGYEQARRDWQFREEQQRAYDDAMDVDYDEYNQ